MRNRYKSLLIVSPLLILVAVSFLEIRCSNKPKEMTHEQMVTRGKYLVTAMACNDCHSPKIMTAMGPEPDTTKLLSGSPSNMPLPKIDTNALRPGYWIMGSPDLTAWIGPWGISFTANLTPDSTTGIGGWTEDNFINALRKGKHLGMDNGRPILPPMPYEFFSKVHDNDLKAMFAYLKSLPPIHNQVHAPIAPPDVMKM